MSITAEYFTDPLSGHCWALQPRLRRLRYTFDLDWNYRFTVTLPTGDDAPLMEWVRAANYAGMPLSDLSEWAVSSSRLACEVAALVREVAPTATDAALRQLRERAFVAGIPPANHDACTTVIETIDGLDINGFQRRLAAGDGAFTLGRDLEHARAVAADLTSVDVRGDVTTGSLATRVPGYPDGNIVLPPTIRFTDGERIAIVDMTAGFAELADVIRGFDPNAGRVDPTAKNYGIEAMQAYGFDRETAERISGADFTSQVREFLDVIGPAYVTEIANGVDIDPETCQRMLVRLQKAGEIEQNGDKWRLVNN
jgi:protein-disulfide isomerase-like protein with CxxC motif